MSKDVTTRQKIGIVLWCMLMAGIIFGGFAVNVIIGGWLLTIKFYGGVVLVAGLFGLAFWLMRDEPSAESGDGQ